MNNKACIVGRIALKEFDPPNEKLQIGTIAGHQVVVGRHYDEGTLGFYIPPDAIIPDKLAEEMWVKGRLAGSKKNRVKSRTVEGVASEGLFYGSRFWQNVAGAKTYFDSASWNPDWKEGDDVTQEVGVTFA